MIAHTNKTDESNVLELEDVNEQREKVLANFAPTIEPDSREAMLLACVDVRRLPAHVAIIMDGNGRWAAQRGRRRITGHRAGVEAVRASVDTGARLGLCALTLYAFSTENWKRPRMEVEALMRMLKRYLRLELDEINRQNIRFQAIGRTDALPETVRREIEVAEKRTASNDGMTLSIALNYGGRAEIVDACRLAIARRVRAGLAAEDVTEDDIARALYTHDLPELDLLIRTSGEMRISNFLLWQVAYSELYVTETLFPDFRQGDMLEAILDFQRRHRRFGAVEPNAPPTVVANDNANKFNVRRDIRTLTAK